MGASSGEKVKLYLGVDWEKLGRQAHKLLMFHVKLSSADASHANEEDTHMYLILLRNGQIPPTPYIY